MSSFRIRPRFKHLVKLDEAAVEHQIKESQDRSDDVCVVDFLSSGHVNVKIPLSERHFWSPQLHLSTEATEDGTIIRGLYGPNPTVWGLFFFGYVSIGILFFFAGFWGLTRWNLGMSYEILWALPILAGAALVLYIIAQTGQKIGAEQMFRLHHFYEDTFHDKVSIN